MFDLVRKTIAIYGVRKKLENDVLLEPEEESLLNITENCIKFDNVKIHKEDKRLKKLLKTPADIIDVYVGARIMMQEVRLLLNDYELKTKDVYEAMMNI